MPVQPAGGGLPAPTGPTINIPAGVTVGPGRETSEVSQTGQVRQGVVFPIYTPAGTNTSVFIPYSQINNTAEVEALIAQRAQAVMNITG